MFETSYKSINEIMTGYNFLTKLCKKTSNQEYVTKGKLRSLRGAVCCDHSYSLFAHQKEQVLYFVSTRVGNSGFQKAEQPSHKIDIWATLRGEKL